jgi:hypothetical protein
LKEATNDSKAAFSKTFRRAPIQEAICSFSGGPKTEPQYFAIFNQPQSIVLVKCLKRPSTESSPIQVLKKMQGYLRKESLRKTDEAWIVVDKDAWTENQLGELLQWAKKSENHGFALSNPQLRILAFAPF